MGFKTPWHHRDKLNPDKVTGAPASAHRSVNEGPGKKEDVSLAEGSRHQWRAGLPGLVRKLHLISGRIHSVKPPEPAPMAQRCSH